MPRKKQPFGGSEWTTLGVTVLVVVIAVLMAVYGSAQK